MERSRGGFDDLSDRAAIVPGPDPGSALGKGPARRHRTARLVGVGVFLTLVGHAAPTSLLAESSPLEYRIKAAFLYNFTRFVRWPSERISGPASPVVLCVVGADPFGSVLESAIEGKNAHGRPLQAKRLSATETPEGCDLVFVSSSEENRISEIIEALDKRSVLTVSETDGFLDRGGMINFVIDDETVGFDVNLKAARRAELQLSSQLLRVAKKVITE